MAGARREAVVMKAPEIPLKDICDVSPHPDGIPLKDRLAPGQIIVYHTHGFRQYMGTAKYHLTVECPHLVHWKPDSTRVGRMSKIIMRDAVTPIDIHQLSRCGTCWKEKP